MYVRAGSSDRRERPKRIFRDIHGAESTWNPNLALGHTPRRPDRRQRPSSATLDCGLFRPAKSSATVSGRSADTGAARTTSRASATSATSPARSPSGIKDRAEIFGSFLVRYAHRPRSAAAVHHQRGRGGHRRSRPAGAPGLDRRQRRRLLSGREDQSVVGVPPAAGGAGVPRHGEGADRRRDRGRLDREGRFPVRLHRQQGDPAARRALGVRGV